MEEKQVQLAQWLESVGQYVREQAMPMRLIDRIDECRESILMGNANWNEIINSTEEILDSIELKRNPINRKQQEHKSNVPVEQIRSCISQMADRCKNENRTTINSYTDIKNNIVNETHKQLHEISTSNDNFNRISYLKCCRESRSAYEKNVTDMMRSLLSEIGKNYDGVVENMRTMFKEAGLNTAGFGSKKIYNNYETKKDGIIEKITAGLENNGETGKEITEFGNKTADKMAKIYEECERKRKKLLVTPAIVIGAIIVLAMIISGVSSSSSSSTTYTYSSDSLGIGDILNGISNVAGDFNIISSSIKTIVQSVPVFLFLIVGIIVAYVFYAKYLGKKADEEYKNGCAYCLRSEVNDFEKRKILINNLDVVVNKAVAEYDNCCLNMLNNIIDDDSHLFDSSDVTEDIFDKIKREWTLIKNK